MIKPFSRIVAYGCSYTAGDELLDAEILHRVGTEEDIDRIKRDFGNIGIGKFTTKYFNKRYVDDKWLNHENEFDTGLKLSEQRKLAWPAQLAKIYGMDYLNRGIGGASIEYCVYRYEEDLINGVITDEDLVIFCIPTPGRFFLLAGHGEPVRSLFNYPDSWITRELYDQVSMYLMNTYHIYWQYYKLIKYINMLAKDRGNILAFFSNVPYKDIKAHYIDDIRGTNHPVDKLTDSIYSMECVIPEIDFVHRHPEEIHGFGHNKISKHIDVAHKLSEYIEKKRIT